MSTEFDSGRPNVLRGGTVLTNVVHLSPLSGR
jgi:hypothetical protein